VVSENFVGGERFRGREVAGIFGIRFENTAFISLLRVISRKLIGSVSSECEV